MSRSVSFPAPPSDLVDASRLNLTPRILRLADGDVAIADQIRGMMWSEYREAGAPMGHSEEGMMVWWDEQMVSWSE